MACVCVFFVLQRLLAWAEERVKEKIFDKVMLVSHLQEEDSILIKEMTQHCLYLKTELSSTEDIKKESKPVKKK